MRAGSARALALLGAAAVGIVGALLWSGLREPTAAPQAPPAAVPQEPPPAPEAYLETPSARTANDPGGAPRPPLPYPEELFRAERYAGTARLEVHVTTPPGVPPPASWSLALEPSPVLLGGRHAVARRVEVEGGAASAVVPDVQLGGYLVRALADGLEAPAQQLELAHPDELDVVLRFDLRRPGFLTGRVVDAGGAPVAGIAVRVEDRAGGEARELVTDASGVYLASPLPEGEYRVLVGRPAAPLARADDVSYSPPSLHMPDLVTPPLGELVVRVVDLDGHPVAGALVEGHGLRSGPIRATTGTDGVARAPNATAGTVRLYAHDERQGAGEAEVEFDPAQAGEVLLTVRP
jgi:hypothetical protein